MFPIEDPRLKNRIVDGLLGVYLSDNVKARLLQPDATYRRRCPARPDEPRVRSQIEFQNMARELSGRRHHPRRRHPPADRITTDLMKCGHGPPSSFSA